jgi:hypothetical protein
MSNPDFNGLGGLKLRRSNQDNGVQRDYKMGEPFAIFHFKYRSLGK